MLQNERIVPIQAIDLLSLYATILKATSVSVTKLQPAEIGTFNVTANGTYIATEPIKTLDFKSTATAATVYFIPAYDFDDIKIAGVGEDAEPVADGCSLYSAELSSGDVTLTKIGL